MSQIAPGTLHKYLTGEVVTGDDTQVATNLNIVFETIRLALNDADTKVNNTYTKAQIDALNYTKAQVDAISNTLTNALNTHKTSADHDGRYYTETEIDSKITVLNTADTTNATNLANHKTSADHDSRYYTEAEIDSKIGILNSADSANTNALTTHKSSSDHDGRYSTKTELASSALNTSGAKLIGVTPISTSPSDLQGMVEWLKNQIDSAVTGTIPDGSIGAVKLAFDPATQAELDTHAKDTSHVGYGAASGAANTYAVTITPAPTAYADGLAVSVKINVDSNAASSLNVNGLGARNIVKSNGTAVSNLKANGVYTLRYNGSTGNFILQGEGGGGTATSADLLSGKTAVSDAGDLVGTMVSRANDVEAITTTYDGATGRLWLGFPTGAYVTNSGFGAGIASVLKTDANFKPANLLAGKTYFGMAGGMTDRGAMSINPSSTNQVIPQGYHNGSGVVNAVTFDASKLLAGTTVAGTAGTMPNYGGVAVDASTAAVDGSGNLWLSSSVNGFINTGSSIKGNDPDYIASNIRNGTNIFGLVGTMNPSYFAYGTATNNKTSGTWTLTNDTTNSFLHRLTVTGLSFKPTYVFILVGGSGVNYTWYNNNSSGFNSINDWTKVFYDTGNQADMREYNIKTGGTLSVTNGGFTLPIGTNNTSTTCYYWAIA